MGCHEAIGAARRWRKALGGGMRQAGILAAAGLYALEHNIERLAEDHANATLLAGDFANSAFGWNSLRPTSYTPRSRGSTWSLSEHLFAAGIRASMEARTRLVTHLDVSRAQINVALEAFREYSGWSS